MTEPPAPRVIRYTVELPDGLPLGDVIDALAGLDEGHRLVGKHVLEILSASSPAVLDGEADEPLTAADRLDRARTAPDRAVAARILTEGEDIPARGDLAALLRSAGWPCSTDTARDLRADLVAARQQPAGPELTAGTGG